MKVGDYVRTKDGIIGRIQTKNYIGYSDWLIDTLYYNDDEIINDWCCSIKEFNVIKSSSDIIDLIEPQDLMFIDIDNDYAGGIVVPRVAETIGELEKYIDSFKNKETTLVGIVTHEQLDNCMYKVVK